LISAIFGIDMTKLTLPAIVVGGIIDSINPCAIGVLIFLMAYLAKAFKTTKMMLLGGVLYISTVYVTYFLAGLGLLNAIQNITVAYFFYWLATFVAFSAGTLELKDFFWYGKGLSLQLIPGSSDKIKSYANYVKKKAKKSPAIALFLTIPIGFAASAFELPCTGQVYLTILALMRVSPPTEWIPLLLLYNFIFVLPLIIITALMYFGVSSSKLETWRKKNRKTMRLFIGLFLYLLGAFLLWYIYSEFDYGLLIKPLSFLLYSTQVAFLSYIIYNGRNN
jgi:cytochrome c biogenesis protein CcdA